MQSKHASSGPIPSLAAETDATAHLLFVELHGGVHPGVRVVADPVGADPGRLVALVRGFEVSLARELVVLGLDLTEDGVLVGPPDADLRKVARARRVKKTHTKSPAGFSYAYSTHDFLLRILLWCRVWCVR